MAPLFVVGIAVCALACFADPAQAATAPDVTLEETTFHFAGTASGAGAATCPGGRRVVGGGIGTVGGIGGSMVLVSGPVDETGQTENTADGDIARGWYASVVNNDGALRSYRVFALCSANSDATIEETSFDVSAGMAEDALATCPPGRWATGGGIGTSADALAAYTRLSGPVDATGLVANTTDGDLARHWYASVFSAAPRTYRVFALCSATANATIEETRIALPARTSGDAVATCPAGRWPTGGGVGTTANTVDSTVKVSGPVDDTSMIVTSDDGDVPKHWYASVENLSSPRVYTVAALCVGDEAPRRRIPSIAAASPRTTRAACVVPRLRGKRLATAKRAIRHAHCRVAKVRRRYSRRVRKGRVIAQSPRPKTTRRAGAKVGLVVSRGPGPRREVPNGRTRSLGVSVAAEP